MHNLIRSTSTFVSQNSFPLLLAQSQRKKRRNGSRLVDRSWGDESQIAGYRTVSAVRSILVYEIESSPILAIPYKLDNNN